MVNIHAAAAIGLGLVEPAATKVDRLDHVLDDRALSNAEFGRHFRVS
ncbi:MAG: hypothetical protein LZF60_420027 [Nitrospira sp.]|nr:MAG: hypothetical protein LZF60_420027 [Nitrospira sp.]